MCQGAVNESVGKDEEAVEGLKIVGGWPVAPKMDPSRARDGAHFGEVISV
jgi:hypothetical protein